MKTFSLISPFLLLFSISLYSQQLQIATSVEKYAEVFPWEKIYLHSDKPHYSLNDTIWVKAYAILEKGDQEPQNSPSVPLYIELFDLNSRQVVETITLKLNQGKGSGNITLSEALLPGVYTLRAYTEWSRNFGEDAYFHKDIWIGESDKVLFPTSTNQPPELHVEFFPEGGIMIGGHESKVGFKGLGADGLGKTHIGYLIENKKDTLIRFESNHLGMGSFSFTPKVNANYEVSARTSSSDWMFFEFPEVLKEGTSMSIEHLDSEKKLLIKIKNNENSDAGKFNLTGISKGMTVYENSFNISEGEIELQINKEDFLPGITQFTLFDNNRNPLAERLVYFHPFAQSNTHFTTDKEVYGPKEYVKMEINIRDEFDLPMVGNFSIAVTDAYQVRHDPYSNNIFSHFQLSSEIKGNIEEPAYYFNPENQLAEKHLDDLMLTQGWRKFIWAPSNQLAGVPEYSFEKGLSLSGQVKSMIKKTEKEPQLLTMMVSSPIGLPDVIEGIVNDNGEFEFNNLNFSDSVAIFLQAYHERERRSGETIQLKFNEVTFNEKSVPLFLDKPVMLTLGKETYIDNEDYLVEVKEALNLMEQFMLNQEIELGEVTVKGIRSDRKVDPRTLMYRDNPSHQLIVTTEHFYFRNVFHLLSGRFPGVSVVGDPLDLNSTPTVYIRKGNARYQSNDQIDGPAPFDIDMVNLQNEGAAFLINGSPASRQTAATIMIQEIERVDIIKDLASLAIFGMEGGGGVINILLKSEFKPTPDPKEGLGNTVLLTKGYALEKQFYTPPQIRPLDSPILLDYRTTIYWQPYVAVGDDGKAQVEFLLTDGSPEIQVELQGVSDLGEPVYAVHKFKVEGK